MPEFYVIIVRKIFSPNYWGTCRLSPVPYAHDSTAVTYGQTGRTAPEILTRWAENRGSLLHALRRDILVRSLCS